MAKKDPFPLPRAWTKTTRSSVLQAISLAFTALTRAWGASAPGLRPCKQCGSAVENNVDICPDCRKRAGEAPPTSPPVTPRRRPRTFWQRLLEGAPEDTHPIVASGIGLWVSLLIFGPIGFLIGGWPGFAVGAALPWLACLAIATTGDWG